MVLGTNYRQSVIYLSPSMSVVMVIREALIMLELENLTGR